MSFKVENCFLCNGTSLKALYKTRDRHYGISGEYTIVQCAQCRLVFLNPMYQDNELAVLYPRTYYAYQDNRRRSGFKDVFKKMLGFVVHTKDPHFPSPGRVLDLGCGSGWFLSEMKIQGWQVKGVEPSAAAVEFAISHDLDVFCGTVEQANLPPEYFDYVRSNHSFEHITKPHETLDEIRRILKPNGLLMIGVPNFDSWNARIFERYWWYVGAPVHPFNYSAATLSRLLEQHGFKVHKITFNSDYAGLLGSIQIWMNRHRGKLSTEGIWFNNYPLRVLAQWFTKAADFFHKGDAIEITAGKADI